MRCQPLLVCICLAACVSNAHGLDVLDVGPPRTGSQTLYEALTMLGVKSLHSGYSMTDGVRRDCSDYMCGADASALRRCMDTFKGYGAAMDEPFHLLYEEVLQENPKAKFVLPDISAEKFYESNVNFLSKPEDYLHWMQSELDDAMHGGMGLLQVNAGQASKQNHSQASPLKPYVQSENELKCYSSRYFGCQFNGDKAKQFMGIPVDPAVHEKCLDGFRQHVKRVKEVIPPSQLLVFNFSDGWAPLAEFLGKPVPDEPFPHVDKFHSSH